MTGRPFDPSMNRPRRQVHGGYQAAGFAGLLAASAVWGPDLTDTVGPVLRWVIVSLAVVAVVAVWVVILVAAWRGLDAYMEEDT